MEIQCKKGRLGQDWPQGNSSDDNSPEISSRSSCGDDDDPSRGLEEFWTQQQLDKWRGLL